MSPYHFSEFSIYLESKSWYNEYAEEQSGGGYTKIAKALKTPVRHPRHTINLVDDFGTANRDAYDMKLWTVPNCKIWVDKETKW